MEARKITIYQTKNQSKKTIMSSAETLAELKRDLSANNIDFTDMTFFEGTAKVELKDNNSVLPHDVPYKGTTTNELVFMLTNTNKKIKSGAMSRTEVYEAIKMHGLQEAVKAKYGKNYTMCKTAELLLVLEESLQKAPNPKAADVKPSAPKTKEVKDVNARKALLHLVDALYVADYIGDDDMQSIEEILDVDTENAETEDTKVSSSYSIDEIEDMFGGWAE